MATPTSFGSWRHSVAAFSRGVPLVPAFDQVCADEVALLFAADGPLFSVIPGFSTRHEQVAMAQAVTRALQSQQQCLIEAGTGVGKTFAYLVPALFARKRIIVSTGTRTLQDQLFHRDLPVIARALGMPVRVAMLKGRANYLCLHRLELAEREAASNRRARDALRQINKIRRWSQVTSHGDISELNEIGEQEPIWQSVTSTRENCLGSECPVFQRCHVVSARRDAQAADVVVVNHHLLMADLVLKERGFGDLLPGADAIVIDEAHQLPDVAAQFLGVTVNARQIQNLCRDLTMELLAQRYASEALKQAIVAIERAAADSFTSLQNVAERCESALWPNGFVDALHELKSGLRTLADLLADLNVDDAALNQGQVRALELEERVTVLLADDSAEGSVPGVRWVQRNPQSFSVQFAPIDVAKQLGALIQEHAAAWIFTSATLAVGTSFAHFAGRIGVSDSSGKQFGSPFDYAEQALMYLPRGLDAPSSPGYTTQVLDAALPVLEASGGRAFILFTSHRALRVAASLLRERWQFEQPYPLLVQGESPREQLLQQFRAAGNAVLLGTSSFWEGIDVKGTALAVVIIDKLPFAAPDEPVLKARMKVIEDRGGNPFVEEQIPEAVIALKQGVGRLIRDVENFGVVMLCDPRLTSRSYGRVFLNSLPPMPRTHSVSEVTGFLRERLTAVGIYVHAHSGIPQSVL
jgi:ATP-dependent DNA helicase DinG